MKCTYFDKHIHLLFDNDAPEEFRRALLLHAEECPACAERYRRIKTALNAATPRIEARASAGLKDRILQAARTETAAAPSAPKQPQRMRLRPLTASLGIAALIAVALLLIDPAGRYRAYAAGRLLRQAASQIDRTRSFYLEIDVRTRPDDNFSLTDPRLPFVPHRMWSEPATGRWRLEKAGRIAFNNGQRALFWNPQTNTGTLLPGPGTGVLEEFAALLDPYLFLKQEEARLLRRRDAVYRKEVGPETITLTVDLPARGDFTNDYMRNSSINESDTHREYRFDRVTGRLTGLDIDIRVDGLRHSLVRLRHIDSGTPLADSLFAAPDGIEWIDLTKPVGGSRFAGISPEEAARKLFEAMQSWDEEVLSEGLVQYPLDRMKAHYGGCRPIEIGEHFRSGDYAGVFVPCRVAMPDGTRRKIILALRRDNPTGAWVADGGL